MKKKNKCLYTNMLNRLSILDDQIYEMQASLAKVREWVAEKIDNPPDDDTSDKEGVRAHHEETGE